MISRLRHDADGAGNAVTKLGRVCRDEDDRHPLFGQAFSDLRAGEAVGTLLTPVQEAQAARKQWLAGHLVVRGRLTLDAGAVRALRTQGTSLLAVGVTAVKGGFERGEVVACLDPDGREVARGLVNYDAQETERILGQPSSKFTSILGYLNEAELIHRDNLVLV